MNFDDIESDYDIIKDNYRERIFHNFETMICNMITYKENDEKVIFNDFTVFLQSLAKNNFEMNEKLQKKLQDIYILTMTQGRMDEAFTEKSFHFDCLATGSFMATDGLKKKKGKKVKTTTKSKRNKKK